MMEFFAWVVAILIVALWVFAEVRAKVPVRIAIGAACLGILAFGWASERKRTHVHDAYNLAAVRQALTALDRGDAERVRRALKAYTVNDGMWIPAEYMLRELLPVTQESQGEAIKAATHPAISERPIPPASGGNLD